MIEALLNSPCDLARVHRIQPETKETSEVNSQIGELWKAAAQHLLRVSLQWAPGILSTRNTAITTPATVPGFLGTVTLIFAALKHEQWEKLWQSPQLPPMDPTLHCAEQENEETCEL